MRLSAGRDRLGESATVADLTVREATALLTEPRSSAEADSWRELAARATGALQEMIDHLRATNACVGEPNWWAHERVAGDVLMAVAEDAVVAAYPALDRAIAESNDVAEVMAVRDVAEVVARLSATMKLWSERLMGTLITEMNDAHPGKNLGTMIAAAPA